MSTGEVLTRATIWAAIAAYACGAALFALARNRLQWHAAARFAWTAACLFLLTHMICAFHFYHAWSHTSAYRDTARQTAEVFGLDWGGGLYINYIFLLGWVVDTAWWWRGLEAYRHRPWPLTLAWHACLFFIFFNGAVVFASGLTRWLGLLLCLGLCTIWWYAARRNAHLKPIQRSADFQSNVTTISKSKKISREDANAQRFAEKNRLYRSLF